MSKFQKKPITFATQQPIVKAVKAKSMPKKADKETGRKDARGGSKQGMLVALLERPTGATVNEMAKSTGWQNHSVLGAISGVLRKRLGLTVESTVESRGRVYRIAGGR